MTAPDIVAALTYPFTAGLLPWPADSARVLLLNAQPSPSLAAWRCYAPALQTFDRPAYNALPNALADLPADGPFDVVLVSSPHQHEEARGLLARAARLLRAGGLLVAAAANDSGGKRLADDFAVLGLPAQSAAKFKARIVWTTAPEDLSPAAADAARRGADFQPVADGRLVACPGVFSWNRIDPGSALLAKHLPALAGRGADFGCGAGFLTLEILERGPASITCIDADWRAVASARRTLALHGHAADFLWADIADPAEALPTGLDWVVMNPPFHLGRAALPTLGQAFIRRAQAALKPGGVLWLVANAHLPYETALTALFATVEKKTESGGFKVYRAVK